MERLPIELQELIYEKAHRLMFTDCLKDIPSNSYYIMLCKQQEKALAEHNDVWVKLYRKLMKPYYIFGDFLDDVDESKKEFIIEMFEMRRRDIKSCFIPLQHKVFDYKDWLEERLPH